MRIATWNINSIRSRTERALDVLERWNLDVLALQELKCKTEQFPVSPFTEAGYQVAAHGINQWNGVAIISRLGLTDIQTEFPNQPSFNGILEPRAISAITGGIRVWSLYVPNGRELDHPHYDYKLAWLKALHSHLGKVLTANAQAQELLVGDWNIAPFDHDVWDIAAFADSTHVSAPERAAFQAFTGLGMIEVTREKADNYTYWDYQKLRFPKNEGMRIDFMYASEVLAKRVSQAWIDREERKGKGASDHVPVIIEIADELAN